MVERQVEIGNAPRNVSVDLRALFHADVRVDGSPPEGDAYSRPDIAFAPIDAGPDTLQIHSRVQADGSVSVWLPHAGVYRVRSASRTFLVASPQEVEVSKPGDDATVPTPRIDLVYDPEEGVITVRAKDEATGSPVTALRVAFRGAGASGMAVSDRTGAVTLEDLRYGTYRVVIAAPTYVAAPLETAVRPGRTQRSMEARLLRANGVAIEAFAPESRARQAGLLEGDVIRLYDGIPTPHLQALKAALGQPRDADHVDLQIVRGGSEQVIRVPTGRLGVQVHNARVAE